MFPEIDPCAVDPCNTTNSVCKKKSYDDYKCICKKGYEEMPKSDWKECQGKKG